PDAAGCPDTAHRAPDVLERPDALRARPAQGGGGGDCAPGADRGVTAHLMISRLGGRQGETIQGDRETRRDCLPLMARALLLVSHSPCLFLFCGALRCTTAQPAPDA